MGTNSPEGGDNRAMGAGGYIYIFNVFLFVNMYKVHPLNIQPQSNIHPKIIVTGIVEHPQNEQQSGCVELGWKEYMATFLPYYIAGLGLYFDEYKKAKNLSNEK